MTIDEAEKLAMETDYAVFASETAVLEISEPDAGAFFYEGYMYAVRDAISKLKDIFGYNCGWGGCRKTSGNLNHEYCLMHQSIYDLIEELEETK